MIVFGPSVNPNIPPDYTGDSPIVGIDNLVTTSNIVADIEDASYPADNLANPSTALPWHSLSPVLQYVTITLGGSAYVDYLGVEGHNFGSEAIAVNVQGWDGTYTLGSNLRSTSVPILSELGYPILTESAGQILDEQSLADGTTYGQIGDIVTNYTAAFDNTTSQAAAACTTKAAATTGYIGVNFTSLAAGKRIFKAVVMGSNDQGFVSAITPTVTLTLYGKTGTTAPASETDGTLIGSLTGFTDTANESAGRTITSTDTSTVYNYVWVRVQQNGAANQINIAELQLFESLQNWTDLTSATTPTDDLPMIFAFNGQSTLSAIRLKMAAGSDVPQAAVIYTGRRMTFQRRVYVGHVPVTMGRATNIVTGMSESGNFLGRIVLGESRKTQVALRNLTADWYRIWMEPFIDAAVESPFFFAWRPATYPGETGFCWLSSDAVPSNQSPNGLMSVTLALGGVAS